jgi:hypothetical protein
MWFDTFRQFLNHSLQRIADWVRGVEILPAHWFHWDPTSLGASLPALEEFGPGEAHFSIDPQHGGWRADLSYGYRSLHCQVRVSILEPTPGMKQIYRMLREPDEA